MNFSVGVLTYYTLLKKKLNQTIGLLSKVWHFTSQHLLKTLYYSQVGQKSDIAKCGVNNGHYIKTLKN